jgi:diguanylate cyclase (GGDEF)-like protein/hemerythrin-like metal-binding protein/PAS domain S-box-containing protein
MDESAEVFPWSDNLATGIFEIDAQHHKLVDLLNALASHLAYKSGPLEIQVVLEELTAYAAYHFNTEEEIWARFLNGDPWEALHRKSHQDFVDAVAGLKAQCAGENRESALENVLTFLAHWLALHILDSDKRLAIAVQAVQAGKDTAQAKKIADKEMSGATRLLIDTVLSMYDKLAGRTLQLLREVVERKKAEAKLRLAGTVLENTLDAICVTDASWRIIEANPSFCRAVGRAVTEVRERQLLEVKPDLVISDEIWQQLSETGRWSGEVPDRNISGEFETVWLSVSVLHDESGNGTHYVAVFSNVAGLLQLRRELEHRANHDVLTGLPNRMALEDRAEVGLARADRAGSFLAICFMDLDGFKRVNDYFGHAAGDNLLKEIAHRIRLMIRGEDTLARMGGDEFVMILGDLRSPRECEPLLMKILEEVRRPVRIAEGEAEVSASIGVAIFPSDGSDAATLIAKADQAMYQAKHAGKARVRFSSSVVPAP